MDRRHNYLLHAIDYGRELSADDNRRRIRAERNGEIITPNAGRSSLPGEARNAGASQRMVREQHPKVSRRAPVL